MVFSESKNAQAEKNQDKPSDLTEKANALLEEMRDLSNAGENKNVELDSSNASNKGGYEALNNPELSPTELNNLAADFLKNGYDGQPENDQDYFEKVEAASQIFLRFYQNPNLSSSNKTALTEKFGKRIGVNS